MTDINDVVAAKVEEARRKAEAAKERRRRIEAARAAGLHYRRRAKLARLDAAEAPSVPANESDDLSTTDPTEGTTP